MVNKLVVFTLAMIVLPLALFFAIRSMGVPPVWAGAVAAGMANVVLVAFIVVAFSEETPEKESEKKQQ